MNSKPFSFNKFYAIFLLAIPLSYFLMLFIELNFGYTCFELCESPYGEFSHKIDSFMDRLYLLVCVLQIAFVFFIRNKVPMIFWLSIATLLSNLFQAVCFWLAPHGGLLMLAFFGFLIYLPMAILAVMLWFALLISLFKESKNL